MPRFMRNKFQSVANKTQIRPAAGLWEQQQLRTAHFEGNSSWDRDGGLGLGTGESDPSVINCKTAAWADRTVVVAGKY